MSNRYRPADDELAEQAIRVLRAYDGKSKFVLKMKDRLRRDPAWRPSEREAEVILRIKAREERPRRVRS